MAEALDLEVLHRDAQAAIKARNYDLASDLLRQILAVDENYKDASRLLADAVRLKRRRWYNDPRVYAVVGAAVVILLVIRLVPRLAAIYRAPVPSANAAAPTAIIPPTLTVALTATPTILPTATPIPLAWRRISMGQDFSRDSIRVIAEDPKDPDVMYVGMRHSGVYKTIDGGVSWRPIFSGFKNTQVESLVVDPKNPTVLYAGTWGGIYKTQDGGKNWAKVGNGAFLLLDPQNNSHLYAGESGTLYETNDGGSTWTQNFTSSFLESCPDQFANGGPGVFALDPSLPSTLYVSVGGSDRCAAGMYQSIDNGFTWKMFSTVGNSRLLSHLTITQDERGNQTMYVQGHLENGGLYISRDQGIHWDKKNIFCNDIVADLDFPFSVYCAGNNGLSTIPTGQRLSIDGIGNQDLTAIHVDHSTGATRLLAGGTGFFISRDGGKTWQERSNGLGLARIELKIDPRDNATMFAASYPLEYSTNGCELFRSNDKAISWHSVLSSGNDSWCGPAFGSQNRLYAIRDGKPVFLEEDGASWKALRSPNTSYRYSGISENLHIPGLLYLASEDPPYLFSSTDFGATWKGDTGIPQRPIRFFQSGKTKGRIYLDGDFFSDDDGTTWESCKGYGNSPETDTMIAVDPSDTHHLYLASKGNGILESNGGCWTWKFIITGLLSYFVNSVALDPNNRMTLYAGADDGAYVTFDKGETWTQVNDGLLGATIIYSIAVDSQSNVYATTPYGVFQLERK
jgi:photosystem II stability/assembly factor-like uncharacterized protein